MKEIGLRSLPISLGIEIFGIGLTIEDLSIGGI
jgi:hypothetical protein